MEFLQYFGLFSRTVENRFVFALFDLLLCGVAALVVVRTWRARSAAIPAKNQLFLLIALLFLSASFGLQAAIAGALLFYQMRFPTAPMDLLHHSLLAGAWLMLAASARVRVGARQGTHTPAASVMPALLLVTPGLMTAALAMIASTHFTLALDALNVFLVASALVLFYLRPLGGRHVGTAAVAILLIATLLHFGSPLVPDEPAWTALWNLEQLAWFLSLFMLALAIGEASRNLFDKVFVRLQIAFILLASLMILAIVQTEKTEYLAGIRARSNQLAEFVRADVDYFQQKGRPLPAVVQQEDFLQRVTLGFGNLPELKIIRVLASRDFATFTIADDGRVHHQEGTVVPAASPERFDSDAYFLIQALPLKGREPGQVEFYGTREFFDRPVRKRIILIFSLFTGMVGLSTLMIGLVVRAASATIRRQALEIEQGERQLMQASKLAAIGELASGVAHEINNPATTILSRASLLLSEDGADSSDSTQEDLRAIVSQAQRIAQITRGLLLFSRPQGLDFKPVSVGHVIEGSLRSVEELFMVKQIRVQSTLEPGLPDVFADEDSLGRALENMFRNAIDAMPGGGTLHIRGKKEDIRLRLEIADTGMGIPRENLGRIFDPFFTTKEVGKGTGLGLSIVHSIIKEHRGTIAVESQPGMGTRFTILLPTGY